MHWTALIVISLGVLMIAIDSTIVNIALPAIRAELGLSEVSLAWAVNAYILPFGGFVLLGGRLGDHLGQRRMFLSGIAIFTIASLTCGLANSPGLLILARVMQGLGASLVSANVGSLVFSIATEPSVRARAIGFLGFYSAAGPGRSCGVSESG
jgi:MFS family permease